MDKARDRGPDERDPFLSQLGAFLCSYCLVALEIEKVVTASVERQDGVPTGYIHFEHFCSCAPSQMRSTRAIGSHPGFVALFGEPPALPYRAAFRWQDVDADDPTVARWRWELEQVSDWNEFMLFLSDSQ
jgi:hypothetical protein